MTVTKMQTIISQIRLQRPDVVAIHIVDAPGVSKLDQATQSAIQGALHNTRSWVSKLFTATSPLTSGDVAVIQGEKSRSTMYLHAGNSIKTLTQAFTRALVHAHQHGHRKVAFSLPTVAGLSSQEIYRAMKNELKECNARLPSPMESILIIVTQEEAAVAIGTKDEQPAPPLPEPATFKVTPAPTVLGFPSLAAVAIAVGSVLGNKMSSGLGAVARACRVASTYSLIACQITTTRSIPAPSDDTYLITGTNPIVYNSAPSPASDDAFPQTVFGNFVAEAIRRQKSTIVITVTPSSSDTVNLPATQRRLEEWVRGLSSHPGFTGAIKKVELRIVVP